MPSHVYLNRNMMIFISIILCLYFPLCASFDFTALLRSKTVSKEPERLLKAELLNLLADAPADVDKISVLVGELVRTQSRKSDIGLAGTWQVAATLPGPNGRPEWTKYSTAVELLLNPLLGTKKNRNFQIFCDSKAKETLFINLSEYFGANFFATASGSCSEINDISKTSNPIKNFNARVDAISLYLKLIKASISIEGSGVFKVLYSDEDIRIVENEVGAKAVQCKVKLPTEYENLVSLYFSQK